jgi:hypothetical protein
MTYSTVAEPITWVMVTIKIGGADVGVDQPQLTQP